MINRMRMRHIRCFLAVAAEGSVTAAADRIHSSQPAVSRSLTELEGLVGQKLFQRTGHGLRLTDEGTRLRRHLELAMAEIEAGFGAGRDPAARPRVSVGILPNVTRTLAVQASSTFKSDEPGVDLALHWAGVPELIARLHRKEIDFILGRLLSLDHMAGVSFEHLYAEPIIFVVSAEHPFASRPGAVSLAEINAEPVVVPLPDTIIRRELDKFTTARGLSGFANRIETVSFEFIRSYLSANRAVACIPLGAVRPEIAAGKLVRLDIHGEELVSSVGISFATGRALSPAAARFADHVRSAAANIS